MKYNILFFLESPRGKNKGIENPILPIMMSVTFKGKYLFYYSGYRCTRDQLIEYELPSGEKIRQIKRNVITHDGKSFNEINKKLSELKNEAGSILNRFETLKIEPTPLLLRKELNVFLGKAPKSLEPLELSFFKCYEEYYTNANVSEGRKKHLKTNMNKLKDFRPETKFTDINIQYLAEFQKTLLNSKTLGGNSVSVQMKLFSSFLNFSQSQGWISENPFKNFKKEQEVYGTPVALTKEERDKLYNAEINIPHLDRVRDIFVFQCFIGCRIGDLMKLKKGNIINDQRIEYIAQKTKDKDPLTVSIPLATKAKNILSKYDMPDGTLLPFISPQKYNEYIRDLFSLLELKRIVTIKDTKTRMARQVALNEIASSHLARRTFIDILYQNGEKDAVIASMSGHVENSKSFSRYRKIEPEMQDEAIKKME